MRARALAIGLLTGLLCMSHAASAFAQERGTPFRGVARGDTRAEVVAALDQIGFRCMTDAEKKVFNNVMFVEDIGGLDVCRIVRKDIDIGMGAHDMGTPDLVDYVTNILFLEMQQMGLLYVVQFQNGRVSEMRLQRDFFNAAQTPPWDFVRAIRDSYPFPDGMRRTEDGAEGITDAGDLVNVVISPNGKRVTLWVRAATADNQPAFN
ncbi:hypothetical protein [Paradevosia shaoguanensis]|uniref:Uncharacterized protein n=1 Tax=Paradevosia shaoguanensis TaxID=1335043 RepID=A0AA41UC60_9HYPH|nr:hypothetical protein [Paradevosia shaoguanensis]MCF1741471.1 hypothetical protein [Paradevosia shaoguanensis]MCI0125954.1 hypothetical protein [Paradevosia shaoguanensis]